VVAAQQNGRKGGLLDSMYAGVCTSTKASGKRKRERDIQEDFLEREPHRDVLYAEWVCGPHQPHTGYLDVAANRIREEIDRVSQLAETLQHLANGYWRAPILVEGLGCN
jgi:hypothetical protein